MRGANCLRCRAPIHESSVFCRSCRGLNQREFVRTWDEVVEEMARREGQRISRQAITGIAERAVRKVRERLRRDPLVREWLRENGYRLDDDDAERLRAGDRDERRPQERDCYG